MTCQTLVIWPAVWCTSTRPDDAYSSEFILVEHRDGLARTTIETIGRIVLKVNLHNETAYVTRPRKIYHVTVEIPTESSGEPWHLDFQLQFGIVEASPPP